MSKRSEGSKRSKLGGFWRRINRAATEVGVEHFADDRDWDARVKLPEWQLQRLKARHAERRARLGLPADPEAEAKDV